MFYVLVASVPLVLLGKWILVGDPKPVKGVYSMPGVWYPLKYCVFWVMLQLRRRQNAAHKLTSGDAGYGLRSRVTVQDMEKAQHLPEEHPLAVDAVYFNGCDGNGNYLVAATARRHENIVQTILLVRVPDLGLLELPSFPETNLKGTEKGEFTAGGLVISPVDPMKTWRLTYSGKLRHVQTGEMRNVTFDLTWSALTRYFDFDTDMNPAAMCSAIATEPWSREFFNRLKEYHQTHYEQFGEMKGNVEIEKFGSRSVSLQGVRDHSYGNIRSWSDLHRYILQYVYTEGGRCVCMGAISMPRTMSRLPMGYIFHPDGTMDSIQSSDFQFYNMGDDGLPLHEFTFHFTAGGRQYELKGKEVASSVFFMGTEWGARVHERLCTYSLNGEPAWGISEWEYRNPLGREAVVES